MKCEYAGDKIGIEGEEGSYCNNKAEKVLRLITIPRNECQKYLIYKRICVCKEHAIYLCNDAPFKWENLPNSSIEEVMKRRGQIT